MESDSLVKIFLALIAMGALIQAALVAGLVIGARMLRSRLGDLEDAVEREVLPRLDDLAEVAARVAEASETALSEAGRIGDAVAKSATRISVTLGAAADRVGGVAEATAERLEDAFDVGARVAERPARKTRAFFKGLRRGLEVWRHGLEPPREGL